MRWQGSWRRSRVLEAVLLFSLERAQIPSLIGARIVVQGAVVDPAGWFAGRLAFTNGLELVVGG